MRHLLWKLVFYEVLRKGVRELMWKLVFHEGFKERGATIDVTARVLRGGLRKCVRQLMWKLAFYDGC